jgi:membrane-bound metal-dependent hydrolase YbcI (DUF457 family)
VRAARRTFQAVDNITHTLVGLTVVRAGLGRRTPGALPVMLVAANAPDLDIVTAMTGGAVPYLAAHRGATHGPLGVVLFGLAIALVIWLVLGRRRDPDRRPSLAALIGVGLIGGVLHVLMDLPTSYGTRILSPFDTTWFAFDWLPIIDIYVWAMLIVGLIAARFAPVRRAAIARVTLTAIVAFYGVRATAHARALDLAARAGADGVASPCVAAPVLTRHPLAIHAPQAPGACLQAAAIPTFFSPFRWMLIRQHANGYELRDVSLLSPAVIDRRWVPSEREAANGAAQQAETARVFLSFSRLPAIETTPLPDGGRRVRFVDVRFLRGPFGFYRDQQAHAPFVATVVVAPDGAVVEQRLGD